MLRSLLTLWDVGCKVYIPYYAIFDKKDVIFPVKQICELVC